MLSDHEIEYLADTEAMISPFQPIQISGRGRISSGLSSYGYDMQCQRFFHVASEEATEVIDPKKFNSVNFKKVETDVCISPAYGFVLAVSVETFKIPRNVMGVVYGKSTYARCGLILNTTIIEADWFGQITLELSNTAPYPLKIYANEGIAQIVFYRGDTDCDLSYSERGGKYQGQMGVTHPCVV